MCVILELTMVEEPENFEVDPSHELDMVLLFSSSNIDAEMEANAIHSLLEASEIPSIVVGTAQIPSLEFQVQVPRSRLAEAEKILAEAEESGPSAALEAEQATEDSGG
jgi:putative signal transducing protein